jgi:hypothetical protein
MVLLLVIAGFGATLAAPQLKYNLLVLDKGATTPVDPASNKTAQDIFFSDLNLSNRHPMLNEPVEISGKITNFSGQNLQLSIALGLAPQDETLDPIAANQLVKGITKNLEMQIHNGLGISVLTNQERSFRLVFKSSQAFETPIKLGLSVVTGGEGQSNRVIFGPAFGNFRVQQPTGFEIVNWLAGKIPLTINLLFVLIPLTVLAYRRGPLVRRKLVAWNIVVTDRQKARPLYWGTLGYALAMLVTLNWPAFDPDRFFIMLLETHWFMVVWMVLPIVYTATFGWWSRSPSLTLVVVTIAYLQLFYILGSVQEANYLMAPVLSLTGASLVAAVAFYLIRKKRGRSLAGIYLSLCSLVLLVSSASAYFMRG